MKFVYLPLLFCFCFVHIHAQKQIQHTTFGNITLIDFNKTSDFQYAMAMSSDGHIVLAGSTSIAGTGHEVALAKLDAAGKTDATFSGDGTTSNMPFNAYISAAAIQPDGKIVVAGSKYNNKNQDAMLARFNADGTPDQDFAWVGYLLTDLAPQKTLSAGETACNDKWNDMAIQPDGKIIVAGVSEERTTEGFFQYAVLARFNADGSADRSFGDNGRIKTLYQLIAAYSWEINSLILQPDGRIITGGNVKIPSQRSALVRFNQNGSIDSTFGLNGYSVANEDYYLTALALNTDNSIIAGGNFYNGKDRDFRIVKYAPNGYLDKAFGRIAKSDPGGSVTTQFEKKMDDELEAIAVQPDGKIVALGCSGDMVAVSRYLVDGMPDESFGTEGKLHAAIDTHSGTACEYKSLGILPNGKIAIAGHINNGSNFDFFLILL